MIKNISFLTTHFIDFDWTSLLVKNILKYTDLLRIKEIAIINQDRTSESQMRLQGLSSLVRVLEYPCSSSHYAIQGHDHANVLNQAIREVKGEYICLFDSDAHPTKPNWLFGCEDILNYYDAILALVPGSAINTHPCFMMMKKVCIDSSLSFDKNLFTNGIDTGRLVGMQLLNSGRRVYFAPPNKAFNGLWGDLYLNVIYHHRKASFHGSVDERIRQQVNWKNNFFKRFVVNKHRYELTMTEYLLFRFQNNIRKRFHLIKDVY